MRLRVSDSDAWYKGLTVSVTSRAADLQMQASYTLGKSEDTGASAIGGNDYDNEGGGSRYLDLKEKGLSPFDVRQSLVASVNWNVPFGRGGTGVTAALIRDWTVGTLVRLKAGDPFSVNTGGLNRGGFSPDAPDYPDLCPGADANPVQGGPEQYFDPTAFCLQPQDVIGNAPRNSVIGPGAATVDLMVSRALAARRKSQPAAALRGVQPLQPRQLRAADGGDLQPERHATAATLAASRARSARRGRCSSESSSSGKPRTPWFVARRSCLAARLFGFARRDTDDGPRTSRANRMATAQRIAIGRPGEPVAPLKRTGVKTNRNSDTPSRDSSSSVRFSRL